MQLDEEPIEIELEEVEYVQLSMVEALFLSAMLGVLEVCDEVSGGGLSSGASLMRCSRRAKSSTERRCINDVFNPSCHQYLLRLHSAAQTTPSFSTISPTTTTARSGGSSSRARNSALIICSTKRGPSLGMPSEWRAFSTLVLC